MELAVQRHLVDDFAAVRLEGGSKIVDVYAAELRHQPIGAARGKAAHHEVIDALLTPPAHDVITLGDLLQKTRNVIGIMLKVAIHGDDVFAGGVIESRSEGRSLAKVSAQLDYRNPTVNGRDLAEQMEGEIRTAIVNEDEFEAFGMGFHHPFQAVIENGYVLLFVMKGDNDRILRHADQIITRDSLNYSSITTKVASET